MRSRRTHQAPIQVETLEDRSLLSSLSSSAGDMTALYDGRLRFGHGARREQGVRHRGGTRAGPLQRCSMMRSCIRVLVYS